MIYGLVFAAGSVALTRVSKAFHQDTKRAVEHHGVYRVLIEFGEVWFRGPENLDYHWKTETQKPFPYDFVSRVQNLQISLLHQPDSLSLADEVVDESMIGLDFTPVLAKLAESVISCRNCNIQLRQGMMYAQAEFEEWPVKNQEFLSRLRTMTVEFCDRGWSQEPWWHERTASEILEQFLGFEKGCFTKDMRFTLIQHSPRARW